MEFIPNPTAIMGFIPPNLTCVKTPAYSGDPCRFYDYAITKILRKISSTSDIDQKATYALDLYSLYHWAMKHPAVFSENCDSIKYIEPDSPYLTRYEESEYYEDLCYMAELHNICLNRANEKIRLTFPQEPIHMY